jgi:hypothetical protein
MKVLPCLRREMIRNAGWAEDWSNNPSAAHGHSRFMEATQVLPSNRNLLPGQNRFDQRLTI